MNIKRPHPILTRYMAPAGGDGSDTGGSGGGDDKDKGVDRGDSFTPTDEDEPTGADKDKTPKKPTATKEDPDLDPDDPDAATGDDKDKGKGGDKTDDGKGGIPYSRHKQLLKKERDRADQLEKQLANYQGGDRIAVTNAEIKDLEGKVTAADEEYSKLITDGKHTEAAAKMKEIRAMEREISEKSGDLKAAASTARAVEKMRYDITVERLEKAYPELDTEHEDYDEDISQDVIDLAATYRAKGLTPAAAIQKAAVRLLGAETTKQEQATTVKARVDEDAAKKAAEAEEKAGKGGDKKTDKADERRRSQVEKNVDAANKQPPDTSKLGADHDKAGGGISAKDVLRMRQEDFNKLDDEALSRMRGDALA